MHANGERPDPVQEFYRSLRGPTASSVRAQKIRPLRPIGVALGIFAAMIWVAICVWIVANVFSTPCAERGLNDSLADCGDVRRATFFLGVAASPVLGLGLALVLWSLDKGRLSLGLRLRALLRIICVALTIGFALSTLVLLFSGDDLLAVMGFVCGGVAILAARIFYRLGA